MKKWVGNNKSTQQKEKVSHEETPEDSSNFEQLKDFSLAGEKLKELWNKTALIRDQCGSIREYYEAFPILKRPVGIELV